MQSLNKATLAYQLGARPATAQRDLSKAYVPNVVSQLNKFMKSPTLGDFTGTKTVDKLVGESERDAVIFYMMNHAISVVRQRVHPLADLGDYLPLVTEYQKQLSQRSARMFYYLLLICTRESRHCKSDYSGSTWNMLSKTYGPVTRTFHETIRGKGSSSAAEIFMKAPPTIELGAYTCYLADVFHKGSYSNGYGGPAWGKVADVLRDFVLGKLTAEMMLDTSFTLAHNNGPIFNKGMLFSGFNTSELLRILDVQRSGQIPQLVSNKESPWANDKQVVELFEMCRDTLGSCMAGYVDWYQVEALGSVGKYGAYKQQQDKNHGKPKATADSLGDKIKAAKQAHEAHVISGMKAKVADELAKYVQIMPGVKVKLAEVR